MRFFPCLLLALFILAVGSVTSQAQEAPADTDDADQPIVNGQQIGAWTVNCVAVAVGQTNCGLIQRITRSSDNAFVADIVALQSTEAQTVLIARVPLGVHLPSGFSIRQADSEEMIPFAWQVCNREVCEALLQLDGEQVALFSQDGNEMVAAFRPAPQSDPLVFGFSLKGMAAGLEALTQ